MKNNSFFLSLILFVVIFVLSSRVTDTKYTILSSPVSLGFDQYNVIKQIKIRFMPETSFHKQDTIMISFSSAIQVTPGTLTYSLIDEFKKQYARGNFNPITDANINTLNLQYFKNGISSSYAADLMQSTWYLSSTQIKSQWLTLVISVPRNLLNTFASNIGSISMAIISSLDVQHLRYQWTNSMSYFYYSSLVAVAPTQSINTILANHIYGRTGETISQVPGAVYPVYLQLTPLIDFQDFVLNLEFTSMTLADLLAKTNLPYVKDFLFQGTCYFICQSTINCITAQYCRVSEEKISVKIGQLIAGKKYVLRFSVLNPPYQATKNIMLWVDSNGTSQDMANIVNQLQTQPITITEDEMKLFWKVPYSIVTQPMSTGGMGLGIFTDGGINTIQIGFKINTGSPFGEILQVKVYVGSTQLIMQSINHNLPSVNTTISYEYVFPNLIIKNVTALTRTNFRYWVAFRTRYSSTAPDNVNLLGSVDIKLTKYPSPSIILFSPLSVTTLRVTIPYSDFRDFTGFHTAGFKNFDTQVISSTDNMLENGTSQAIRKYFNQPTTTVGVDPDIINQQLLFLLNVPDTKISLGTVGEKYDTRIFINPNIFQSVSNKGISLVAYNGATTKWDNFGNDCYVDQQPLDFTKQTFMCQKYNDHVFDQQFDNVLNTQTYFKYYEHTCGNGIKVKCLVPPCKTQCTLFKGYTLAQGKAGIIAIRNVTFISNYQSPVQASDKNFDFIIAFYHNGAFVSSTLINAYTIKSLPLKRTSLSFINTYHDGIKYNLGDKIPTLIKLSGRLQLSQFINLQYPQKMKLYFPSTKVALNSFVSGINEVGCSYYCRFNESKSLAVTQNWLQWHSVSIENMPQLTNDFKILLPVQLKDNLMSIYVGFQSKGKTVAIYRFGGSAVNQSISLPLTNLFTTQSYATPWDLVSDWVIGPTFSYLQKINLQQTNQYDNFTLVTMSGSVMPAHAKPFMTFSVQNLQMLAPYTFIIVGNSLQNKSCDKLSYSYNLKKIECFICQLYTNDNTTNNNIRIEYPLYNNDLGPGYPYDQLFNFAYASDAVHGQLQGIRRETGDKVLINSCKTNKATEYNVGQVGRQLQRYRIQIDPILLSASTYKKLQLVLQIPNNIQPVECSIIDVIFFSKLSCTVLSQVSNVTTLQISILPTQKVNLLEFFVYLNCYQTGAVSLAAGQLYRLKINYPHTNGALQQIYGSTFSPYSSTVYQCQNSFTYINAAYNNSIIITSHKLNSVGVNMNTQLQFSIILSKQKSHLLKNSYIEFIFNSNLQVTQHTYCYMERFSHRFWTRTWTAGSYKLYTNEDIDGFTAQSIIVKCSNLVLKGFNPTLIVRVFDITANLQIMISSNGATYPLIVTPYFTNPSPIASTGTITSKQYTTLGFNSLYTIAFSISGTGLVEGIIDLSQYSIDYRLLRCQLSIAQDVFCKLHQLSTNTSLQSRSRHVYFKTFFTTAFSSFTLMIYPILQQKRIIAPTMSSLINVINTVTGTSNLYSVSITDSLPTIPVDDVFLINDYKVTPIILADSVKFALEVTFTFTLTISRPLYLQLNEIFFFTLVQNVVLTCTINGFTIIPCTIVEKDLIKIDTSTYTLNLPYTIKIQSFDANYQIILKDKENFFFRMFVIDPATKEIDYVSYMNAGFTLPTSLMSTVKSYQTMFGRSSLIWNITDPVTHITYIPKIYVGYYGKPVDLIEYNSNKFTQDFLLSSNNYTLSNFNCQMGLRKCSLSLIAEDFSTVFKSIYFTHLSSMYNQPPALIVQVSNEKCVINAEFVNYKIFQNGITLPILLNFTHCRPRSMLTIVPTFNSTEVSIDLSLSQLEVTQNNPIGIIFVRHSSTDVTLKNYLLTLTLTGTYSSSFTIPSTFTIEKIVRTQTNIQAKAPQTINLQSSELKVRIQCNEPSTVYWAVGIYPTTLGVKGQDIQTRLLNGQVGLWTSIIDYLTYGNLEYGLTYTEVPNVWKQLIIDELLGTFFVIFKGNTMYSFKYFCVNIKGTFSDGKILTFTTPVSIYSMVKLQLGFTSPLNYGKVNNFACAISQSLVIPYKQTITSVNSNCKNASLIFFDSSNDIIWNYNITSSPTSQNFFYNFYIKSFTLSSSNITSLLRDSLRKNFRIIKSQLPIWSDFGMQFFHQYRQQIEPNAITPLFNGDPSLVIDQTVIEMTFPIRNQISYVIVGLLSSYFNNQTMSLPSTYMIKQGKFSQNVDFDRVYMNYTTGDIKFTFDGLNADTQYSIFYFVTVDDPSINAKHSQVKYVNVLTAPYLQVDLFGTYLTKYAIYWMAALFLTIFVLA